MESTHPLKRLLAYSSPYKSRIYLAVFSSIFNKIFDLAPPLLIGAAVDIVVRKEHSFFASFGIIELRTQLVVLAFLTFVIWFLESLFDYLSKWFWRNLAQIIQHELRIDTYAKLQDLDMAFFEDQQTGSLMAILNDDINQLERFLDIGANSLIQVTTTVIVIGATFFAISPKAAIIGIFPMPFVILFSLKFQSFIGPKYAKVREHVSILNAQLNNNLTGIATIKSYTTESIEQQRIRSASLAYLQANRNAIRWSSAFSPLIRMIIVIGFTGMLVIGGFEALNGTLEAGAYTIMVFLTQRLLWPLTSLGETFDQYQRAMASTNRIFNLLDTSPSITSGSKHLDITTVQGSIIFEHVEFTYQKRKATLKDLNVEIYPGETVAFVGSTGAGKTTIVKLLLRFYDPQHGRILLDGTDIKSLDIIDLRKAIALVSQDVFLIDGTVYENITYGSPQAKLEDVINAAKIAEAHEFITKLPDGYDTLVGERGQKLSGGQRQRISIARAILKNSPIMIFDEATSSVDNETEAAIQRSLERITKNRTTILIAHRLSTIRNANRIFVLDTGRIVETGTHHELIAKNGIYKALWDVQTGQLLRNL